MKNMKNKTIPAVFIIIGFFANFGMHSLYAFILKANNYDGGFIPFGVFAFISLIISISALRSLHNNNKRIALGILLLIFCGVIGGIFYLIWIPEDETVVTTVNENGSTINSVEYVSYSEDSDDPYQQLKKLRDLLDRGIIDKQTYDEKAKKYIKKL